MLLRFRVANHRSIRDAVELSLASSRLDGTKPSDSDWQAATVRVAGIYGANASGKSTILDAIAFACAAVEFSFTRWAEEDSIRHHPFLLDSKSRQETSFYEFDIVIDGVRYTYGFESSVQGFSKEWLYSYPASRRRVLFERHELDAKSMEFGRHLPGENVRIARLVRPTSLFLSTAAQSNHTFLRKIHDWFANHIVQAKYSEADREVRLRWVRDALEDSRVAAQALGLLKFADLGIASVVLAEEDLNEELKALLRRLFKSLAEAATARRAVNAEDFFDEYKKKLSFLHTGADASTTFPLPLENESSGTVAWLSLGVPALTALGRGDVFIVDELDASLHPRLASALVGIFKDPELNPRGAQLVFTSHDTSLLGHVLGESLSRDEVWFTEKGSDGATTLFALNEFPARASDNFEKRYLQGRYGAVPMISREDLRAALMEDAGT
ncbi:ATP-binding protein [Actinomadura sp. DC4]|uniref:AAA family ATPase n=1 Tax=Actinomadura sp. DC4 TaxID=3055069 RepID=UPI0025AEF8B9|nr:ATP-binding protein [Actinomadura sp. DC4]MDN3355875.1 ATP-binding protein [Actinomadura sp. DC4]